MKWLEPRIFHSDLEDSYESRIQIGRIGREMDDMLGRVFSPNKAYWFSQTRPNFEKEGPWSTVIRVFNERDSLIAMKIIDHSNYEVKTRWINEKLLYVEMWWGRIVGSYLIFDVEDVKIVAREMMHDGTNPFQQYMQNSSERRKSIHKPSSDAVQRFQNAVVDSTIALSRLVEPFYLEGDFNGDQIMDYAFAVERKADGKGGIAIIHGNSLEISIIGAGKNFGNGGDDFKWLDRWDVIQRSDSPLMGASTIPPSILKGDGLLLEKIGATSALIYWTGLKYEWYQQGE